jgi:hypothetical protein
VFLLIVFRGEEEKGKEYQVPEIKPNIWLMLIVFIKVYDNIIIRDWLKDSISTDFHKVKSSPFVHCPPSNSVSSPTNFGQAKFRNFNFRENGLFSPLGTCQVGPN